MRSHVLTIAALSLIFMLASSGLTQQSAEELYQSGIYKEEVEGDLQKAIEIYQRILKQFPDNREIAAKAQLHIGLCYEKLGLKEAPKAFQKVVDNYPEQTEAVKIAREKLSILIRTQALVEKEDREFRMTKVPTDPEKTGFGFISPDGEKLAYVGKDGDIWIREIASSKDARLNQTPIFDYWCFWAPDSETVAYLDALNGLHVASLKGGEPKTLIAADSEFIKSGNYAWPTGWSPDSRTIICQVSKKGLYGIPISGGEWKDIFKFTDPEQEKDYVLLTLSPNGKFIAYESKKSGNDDIYIMPVPSGEPIQITDHPASDIWPIWSFDGRWIAFISTRSGDPDLWVTEIGPNGERIGDPILVYQDMPRRNSFFSWAKDGKIGISKTPAILNVFIANSDGSGETQLTKILSYDMTPRWSPDSKHIAYISEQGGKRNLWIIPSEGGEAKMLTANFTDKGILFYINSPTWLPDGENIAFNVFFGEDEDRGMWMIPSQGGIPSRVKFDYDGSIENMDWSPNGQRIAFDYIGAEEGNPIKGSRTMGKDIYVFPVKGGEPIRITQMEKELLYFYSPRWSPDGKRIAFRSFSWLEYNEGKESEQIWVVDVESLDPKPITEKIKGNIRGLSWSPDGKNIIFSKLDEDKSKICIVSSEGGEIQYLNIEGISPDYSPDGSKIAYVKRLKTINEFWLIENFLPEKKK